MKQKLCKYCGKPVPDTRRATAKYCSIACRRKAKNAAAVLRERAQKRGRVCEYCGGPVPETLRSDAKYCSLVCSRRVANLNSQARAKVVRKERNQGRVCIHCGRLYRARRSHQKYCSYICRNRANGPYRDRDDQRRASKKLREKKLLADPVEFKLKESANNKAYRERVKQRCEQDPEAYKKLRSYFNQYQRRARARKKAIGNLKAVHHILGETQ